MKTFLWVAFCLIVILVAASWNSYSPDFPGKPQPRTTPPLPSPHSLTLTQPVNSAQVDPVKIWRHLEALAGERYTETERSQARHYIVQQLQAAKLSPSLQPYNNSSGTNIVAQRPGTNPTAGTILVAAHYDTVPQSPGADDNATGVAAVLEVARLFSSTPTPRTLQVVFFDQEEIGLLGSLAFTGDKTQLQNLQAAVILDMVGHACHTVGCQRYPEGVTAKPFLEAAGIQGDRGEFLAVVGDAEHLPLLGIFSQGNQDHLPPVLTLPIPFKGLLTPDVLRSDHAPFWYNNIGAVLVTDTANFRSPHYHQPSDQLETLDRAFFVGAAQVVVNAVTALLESQESLAAPQIP